MEWVALISFGPETNAYVMVGTGPRYGTYDIDAGNVVWWPCAEAPARVLEILAVFQIINRPRSVYTRSPSAGHHCPYYTLEWGNELDRELRLLGGDEWNS